MSFTDAWYRGAPWLKLLRPLSWLTSRVARRRFATRLSRAAANPLPVPVIVVGNISVGGTGKTPLTIAIIEQLRRQGLKPGVISRGYGARPSRYPFSVTVESLPKEGGDEPCLIAQRTGVPVYIDPDRVTAARALLAEHDCNVLISDDGLQHYALPRTVEIAVIDGSRGLGNGRCLPEGPLREPPERLLQVDLVVVNGEPSRLTRQQLIELQLSWHTMGLEADCLYPLNGGDGVPADAWPHAQEVDAVAGIGNPARFFDTLRSLGFDPIEHPLADHAELTAEMLEFTSERPLIMTEKDAVKCKHFAPENGWALRVNARLDTRFEQALMTHLRPEPESTTGHNNGPETA